jgi:hypothetical protein
MNDDPSDALLAEIEKRGARFPKGSPERNALDTGIESVRRWRALPPNASEAERRDALGKFKDSVALWSEIGVDTTEVRDVLDDATREGK